MAALLGSVPLAIGIGDGGDLRFPPVRTALQSLCQQ
jgi:hypothetical protein